MANHCKLCNVIIDSSNNIVCCNCGKGFHKNVLLNFPICTMFLTGYALAVRFHKYLKYQTVQLPLMCLLNQSLPLTVLLYLLKD